MYETQTYDSILQRLLDSVDSSIDTREGSLVYTALAPAAAELAQMYLELSNAYNLIFADTATGDFLTRRCSELGINRKPATKALRTGLMYDSSHNPLAVPINTRFGIDGLIYTVIEEVSTGVYLLECQTAGAAGNTPSGDLQVIDYVANLAEAKLDTAIVPGTDEETDDQLRKRYFESVNSPAFGGNKSDYKIKTKEIDNVGVGAVKVFPVWNGGGTVKLVILDPEYNPASNTLVDDVQAAIDPLDDQGRGKGIAPIGHVVTVTAAGTQNIDLVTTLTLDSGYSLGGMQSLVEQALDDYLLDLRQSWENDPATIVRISQIDSRILNIPGIVDVVGTKINGGVSAVTLGAENIPVRRTVTLSGN